MRTVEQLAAALLGLSIGDVAGQMAGRVVEYRHAVVARHAHEGVLAVAHHRGGLPQRELALFVEARGQQRGHLLGGHVQRIGQVQGQDMHGAIGAVVSLSYSKAGGGVKAVVVLPGPLKPAKSQLKFTNKPNN